MFKENDRVTVTVYGIKLEGVVTRDQTSLIVFVRTGCDGRKRWFHQESVSQVE